MDEREEFREEMMKLEADEFEAERREMEREAEEYWSEHISGKAFGISDKDFI